jgi:hypothetical protein
VLLGQYIFQASVDPPQRFYRNLDQQAIKFGLSRPDLLRVVAASTKSTSSSSSSSSSSPSPSKRSLVIIDAKSSAKTKFSQQVQVAFYALLLQALIDEEHIDDLEIGAEGGTQSGHNASISVSATSLDPNPPPPPMRFTAM